MHEDTELASTAETDIPSIATSFSPPQTFTTEAGRGVFRIFQSSPRSVAKMGAQNEIRCSSFKPHNGLCRSRWEVGAGAKAAPEQGWWEEGCQPSRVTCLLPSSGRKGAELKGWSSFCCGEQSLPTLGPWETSERWARRKADAWFGVKSGEGVGAIWIHRQGNAVALRES